MFHFVMTSVMLLQTFLIWIYTPIYTPPLSVSMSALFCPQDKLPHGLCEQAMSCGGEKFGPQKTGLPFLSWYVLINFLKEAYHLGEYIIHSSRRQARAVWRIG